MEIKLQGINLTDLAAQGGDLLATIKSIYDDASFADFRIAAAFTMAKGTSAKPATELVLVFQKP